MAPRESRKSSQQRAERESDREPESAEQPEAAGRSPVSSRVDLGMVSLNAAPGWRFYPLDGRIVARPASGVGVFEIVALPPDAVMGHPSHERCMAAAVAASSYEVEPPGIDRAKEQEEQCLAGGESFRVEGDFVRIWYRHCPDGMVAAWFGCKETRAAERSVLESMRQCDHMISSVRLPPPVS
jgi:hypothetical protein